MCTPSRTQREGQFLTDCEPIVDGAGRRIGLITTFQDITDQEDVLRQAAKFNLGVGVAIWFSTVSVFVLFLLRTRGNQVSCSSVLSLDESDRVEFKSSLRWDYENQKVSREMEAPVVKAVAGFLNSENGGTIAIGVSDEKKVLGLERDYATFTARQNRDGFEQFLRQSLVNAIGSRCCAQCVSESAGEKIPH